MKRLSLFVAILALPLLGASCLTTNSSPEESLSSTPTTSAPTDSMEKSMDKMEKENGEESQESEETTTTPSNEESATPSTEEVSEQPIIEESANEAQEETPVVEEVAQEQVEEEPKAEPISYTGRILSAGASPVIEFNQSDYEKALAANKVIVLTYYASWCPTCRKQEPEHFAALSSLNNPNVVAFRVNFRDSDTSDAEEAIARTYGVSSQDTKVIVANGQRVVKTLTFWDQADYISQINAHL